MAKIQQINECFDHHIISGTEFLWKCYGDNARYLDYESDYAFASVVYDTKTLVVYEADILAKDDTAKDNTWYVWFNPEYREEYIKEYFNRGCSKEDYNSIVELEVFEDYLTKAKAIFNNLEFDRRIAVPIELDDDLLVELMTQAHNKDITLNQYISSILEAEFNKQQYE